MPNPKETAYWLEQQPTKTRQWIKRSFALGYLAGFRAAGTFPYADPADVTVLKRGRSHYENQEEV